jgi:ABC-2 type transport system permease protein
MIGSVYRKTMFDLRWHLTAWSVGLAAVAAVNVLLYPTVQQMPGLLAFLENLPPAVKAMIGDVREMAVLEGFLRVKLFDPLPLLLAVFGVSHGAQMIAGEKERKTMDLLMGQPIRRWHVVLEKYVAVATACTVLCCAVMIALLVSILFVGSPVRADHLVLATANALPLTWLFTALAIGGSCLFRRSRQAAFMAGSVVVSAYVFEALRLLSPTLSSWRSVSLFAQHKAGYSLSTGLHAAPILLLLGIALLVVVASAAVWERRDLLA